MKVENRQRYIYIYIHIPGLKIKLVKNNFTKFYNFTLFYDFLFSSEINLFLFVFEKKTNLTDSKIYILPGH